MTGSKGVIEMTFIQLIEYKTDRMAELDAAMDEWLATSAGHRTATRGIQCRDRDHPHTCVSIVEFPSYEEAMANSDRPETTAFAETMISLCEEPPTFHNLEVIRDDAM